MIKKHFSLLFTFFLLHTVTIGQHLDSLKIALKKAGNDTSRCSILSDIIADDATEEGEIAQYSDQLQKLCEQKLQSDPRKLKSFYLKNLAAAICQQGYLYRRKGEYDKAVEYYGKSRKIQEEIGDKKGLSSTIFNTGVVYQAQNNTAKALDYFLQCKKVQEEINNKQGLSETYFSIGSLYNFQGNIPKALDYYSNSLKIAEACNHTKVIAYSLNNIGSIYSSLDDYAQALTFYSKSLKIYENNKDKTGIAIALNNIGGIYKKQGNISKALDYFSRGLKVAEDNNDKKERANSLFNTGTIYNDYQNKPDEALDCFTKSLKLQEEIGYKKGIANSLCNIGKVYLNKKNYATAESFAQRSLTIGKEIGFPQNILNAATILDQIYEMQNKPALALQVYKLSITMRDSINNTQVQKASIKRELQYNYEKKAAADSVVNAKEKEVRQAQISQQQAEIKAKRNQQYALFGGLALVLVFAGFMYNRFKITQRQKIIIEQQEKETRKQKSVVEEQKQLIEEKHKEITDSINYAERIQRSFLASKTLLDEHLPSYFVFFQPKDVVSGDFYWAAKLANGNFACITADSTGHGVPGAIMSILNISSLEKAVEKQTEPSAILNETRNTIIERLKKDGSNDGGKDGMDCSLISFDLKNNRFTYAAANNPIWIARENKILEFVSDKMPVGKHDKDNTPFTQHTVKLQKGDVVYTFTDGMPDQFGGSKGKKFLYKQLKELLISISHLPMEEQKEKLSEVLNGWKGGLEQTDDITIMGVRV
ncbi:MAG: protein serine/threonine phosphatase [Bacteroidetes bacterium]|nr:protein serine/threonine phosphatase [Bacteroidota bacterium]